MCSYKGNAYSFQISGSSTTPTSTVPWSSGYNGVSSGPDASQFVLSSDGKTLFTDGWQSYAVSATDGTLSYKGSTSNFMSDIYSSLAATPDWLFIGAGTHGSSAGIVYIVANTAPPTASPLASPSGTNNDLAIGLGVGLGGGILIVAAIFAIIFFGGLCAFSTTPKHDPVPTIVEMHPIESCSTAPKHEVAVPTSVEVPPYEFAP